MGSSTGRLTLECKAARSPDQVSSALDRGSVVLNLRDSVYHGLNPVGSRIWELLSTPQRIADVCQTIQTEYEVDADKCARDTLNFVQQLADNHLIEVHGELAA